MLLVVELFVAYAQPVAEANAARIVPWDPAFMHAPPGSLSNNDNFRIRASTHDRTDAMGQRIRADLATPDFA